MLRASQLSSACTTDVAIDVSVVLPPCSSDPGPYDYRPRIHRRLPPRSVLSRPVSTRSTMSDTDGHTVSSLTSVCVLSFAFARL